MVPGSVNLRQVWAEVAARLDGQHACWLLDRRGKGDSGDTLPYALEREVDDLAAVAASFDGPVGFAGHSSGAIVVLMAVSGGMPATRLVLYEPPWLAVGAPDDRIGTIEALLAAGDRDGALEFGLREMVGMPDQAIAGMRAGPAWPMRLSLIHTWPREMRALEAMSPGAVALPAVTAPTLLLDGAVSGQFLRRSTAVVAAALPHATVTVLAGRGTRRSSWPPTSSPTPYRPPRRRRPRP